MGYSARGRSAIGECVACLLLVKTQMDPGAATLQPLNRPTSLPQTLEMVATVFTAVVAGTGLDRVVVQMPAWRRLGARPWAEYSRFADLRNGRFLYPLSAIGGGALSVAAAIAYGRNGRAPRTAGTPILLSVLLSALGLALTTKAAPQISSVRRVADDPVRLQRAFKAFDEWGRARA